MTFVKPSERRRDTLFFIPGVHVHRSYTGYTPSRASVSAPDISLLYNPVCCRRSRCVSTIGLFGGFSHWGYEGSSYPNVTISNSYHSQGVERLYFPFWPRLSLIDSSCLCRVRKYVDHDLRPRSCKWRWQPHKQIRTYWLVFTSVKDQQYHAVFSADFLGWLLVQLDTYDPWSVRCFHTWFLLLITWMTFNTGPLRMDWRPTTKRISQSRVLSRLRPCQKWAQLSIRRPMLRSITCVDILDALPQIDSVIEYSGEPL